MIIEDYTFFKLRIRVSFYRVDHPENTSTAGWFGEEAQIEIFKVEHIHDGKMKVCYALPEWTHRLCGQLERGSLPRNLILSHL